MVAALESQAADFFESSSRTAGQPRGARCLAVLDASPTRDERGPRTTWPHAVVAGSTGKASEHSSRPRNGGRPGASAGRATAGAARSPKRHSDPDAGAKRVRCPCEPNALTYGSRSVRERTARGRDRRDRGLVAREL